MINSKKIPNKIRLIQSAQMVRELEKFEKKNAIQGFKFGILYAKEGQTKEEDFLSNTKGSEEYDDFLVFLGEKINLKGWNSFRAGKKKNSYLENKIFILLFNFTKSRFGCQEWQHWRNLSFHFLPE